MTVTRLERKARRNKSKAKERTRAIKRNIRKITIKSPYKAESGIVLDDDIAAIIEQLGTTSKPKEKAKPSEKIEKEVKAVKKTSKDKGDKLTKIEGVGPKIAETLTAAGLSTFAQVADSTPEAIREILDNAEGNFAAHNPGTWPKQALLASEGKWDELKVWQDELDGGK